MEKDKVKIEVKGMGTMWLNKADWDAETTFLKGKVTYEQIDGNPNITKYPYKHVTSEQLKKLLDESN